MQFSLPVSRQVGLNGLHATLSRQLPAQRVPLSVAASRLATQEALGHRPVDKQQCPKQLPAASHSTLGSPLAGHIIWSLFVGFKDWGQVRVTFRSRTRPASTRPATRFIGNLRVPGDSAKGDESMRGSAWHPGPRTLLCQGKICDFHPRIILIPPIASQGMTNCLAPQEVPFLTQRKPINPQVVKALSRLGR
jgi:hypothetical protein